MKRKIKEIWHSNCTIVALNFWGKREKESDFMPNQLKNKTRNKYIGGSII